MEQRKEGQMDRVVGYYGGLPIWEHWHDAWAWCNTILPNDVDIVILVADWCPDRIVRLKWSNGNLFVHP